MCGEIVQLHDLARQELPRAMDVRYMPQGWTRAGDRRARSRHDDAAKAMEQALLAVPERLLVRPTSREMEALHASAAEQRAITQQVRELVRLLSLLPEVQQDEAYAVSVATEQELKLNRLDNRVSNVLTELATSSEEAAACGIDLSALTQELQNVLRKIQTRQSDLSHQRQALERSLAAPSTSSPLAP